MKYVALAVILAVLAFAAAISFSSVGQRAPDERSGERASDNPSKRPFPYREYPEYLQKKPDDR